MLKTIARQIPQIDRLVRQRDNLLREVAELKAATTPEVAELKAATTPAEQSEADHQIWMNGIPHEIEFWQQVIEDTHPNKEWVADMRHRASGQYPFPEHLATYLNRHSMTRILDVGAGPITTIGYKGAPSPIEVVPIDPLADIYNALLDERGFGQRNRTLKGEGERLFELGLGVFDLVHSRNALDHSYDPVRIIREMVSACKPTGTVFFEGHTNESFKNNCDGLHQWNFMAAYDGDLIIWQLNKIAYSLRWCLGHHMRVQATGQEWYRVEIQHIQAGSVV